METEERKGQRKKVCGGEVALMGEEGGGKGSKVWGDGWEHRQREDGGRKKHPL